MKPSEFNPASLRRGQKYAFELDLDGPAVGLQIPLLLVQGGAPGKVLVAVAGVHGDEYEGVRAILDTYTALDPLVMSGDFLAVPYANPPAFQAGARTSPLDGENLARLFPGSMSSGPSAAIARTLTDAVLARADFLVDLHSAGVKLLMPTLVGYDSTDSRSLAAALAFGAPVLWAHSDVPPGRTVSAAKTRGTPWLYTEARGGGRIHPEDLCTFNRGIQNLLRHLAILPGEPQGDPVDIHLSGNGDIDESIQSNHRGLFIPSVELLQRVDEDEVLGRTVDFAGRTLEDHRAQRAGVVVLIRQSLAVEPGDSVFLVTGMSDSPSLKQSPIV